VRKMLVGLIAQILIVVSSNAYSDAVLTDKTKQWKIETYVSGLLGIDNIVLSKSGEMYATQELKWIGRLIRIDLNKKMHVLIQGLNRPDGLLLYAGKLYITEEVANGRILQYDLKTRVVKVLFRAKNPEGIDHYGNGEIIVSEDAIGGSIIKWSLNDKDKDKGKSQKQILIKSMFRPEGLCVDQKQQIYIAETAKNRIVRFANNQSTVVVDKLRAPDQVECHADGSIWISEDKSSGRILRFYNNQLEVIAKDLNAPQGIAFGLKGEVYIAEQGKSRIIKLTKTAKASKAK